MVSYGIQKIIDRQILQTVWAVTLNCRNTSLITLDRYFSEAVYCLEVIDSVVAGTHEIVLFFMHYLTIFLLQGFCLVGVPSPRSSLSTICATAHRGHNPCCFGSERRQRTALGEESTHIRLTCAHRLQRLFI